MRRLITSKKNNNTVVMAHKESKNDADHGYYYSLFFEQ